jgi:hypothetical protein
VEDWDPKSNFVSILSKNNFKIGEIIKGSSSKTQGVAFQLNDLTHFLILVQHQNLCVEINLMLGY